MNLISEVSALKPNLYWEKVEKHGLKNKNYNKNGISMQQ